MDELNDYYFQLDGLREKYCEQKAVTASVYIIKNRENLIGLTKTAFLNRVKKNALNNFEDLKLCSQDVQDSIYRNILTMTSKYLRIVLRLGHDIPYVYDIIPLI